MFKVIKFWLILVLKGIANYKKIKKKFKTYLKPWHVQNQFVAYSELWHNQTYSSITQGAFWLTSRYIHISILNILTKTPSWTFDLVLSASVFYVCYLTSRVSKGSLTLYFRYIHAYSRLIQSYWVMLRHIMDVGLFRNIPV